MTIANKFILILTFIEIISVFKITDDKLLSKNIDIKPPESKNNTVVLPALVWKNPIEPSGKTPAIFYSPHQDDETLAMGASIAECVRLGKPVYVVLFTNGASSVALLSLNGITPCRYHHTTHHFNLSRQDFINARNAEFIAACKTLGVHRIYIANNGSGWDESIGLTNMTTRFYELITFFENQFPFASHKTISGNCDYTDLGTRQDAHRAAATAMQQLYIDGCITDVQLYKDYVYYYPGGQRTADCIKHVVNSDMDVRQHACDEYQYFNPATGRYSIGYAHSVWQLFNDSYSSDREYIDYPKNVCNQ